MAWKNIKLSKDAIESTGKMNYCESLRAWAIIRLKQGVTKRFSELSNRISRLNYKLTYHESYAQLEKIIRKMKKNKENPPFLLIINKRI